MKVFFPATRAFISLTISTTPLVLFLLRTNFNFLTKSPSVCESPFTVTSTVGSAFATRNSNVKFAVLPFSAVNVKVTSLPSSYAFAGLPERLLPSSFMPSGNVEPVATLTVTFPTTLVFFT